MKYTYIAVVFLTVLSGCDKASNEASVNNAPVGLVEELVVGDVLNGVDVLTGTWTSCYPIGEKFVLYTSIQKNSVWQDTYLEFDDAQCSQATIPALSYENHGTYKLGAKVELQGEGQSQSDVYEITLIEDDAGKAHECYTLVTVAENVMYYGVIDKELDCKSLDKRSVALDFTNKLERISKEAELVEIKETDKNEAATTIVGDES